MLFGQVNSAKSRVFAGFPLLGGEAAIKQPGELVALLQIAFGGDMSSYFLNMKAKQNSLVSCEGHKLPNLKYGCF